MKGDAMLIMITATPFLMGVLFRFGIPFAEGLLTGCFGTPAILSPYYALFDLFLLILTPAMFNYAAAMVMLEEADDHIAAYLAITPLGKAGYLCSRLGFSALIAFAVSAIVGLLFRLSQLSLPMLLGVALAGMFQGAVVALLIAGLSKNKVEGMAMGKFTSLLSLGAFAPYFLQNGAQYLASPFPAFWIAKAVQSGAAYSLPVSMALSLLYITLLYGRFAKKLAG